MKKILVVFGTRPEAIKLAPLIKKLQAEGPLQVQVCVTGQHAQMLDQVLDFFTIVPDCNLKVMQLSPTLSSVYGTILNEIGPIIDNFLPDLILVHGDTATTAAAAMAGFLKKIPIGHIEAGLRTGDISTPWPEEFNRRIVGLASKYHFAPTEAARNNLLAEGVPTSSIFVTGNTVIDSLFYTLGLLEKKPEFLSGFFARYPFMDTKKKTILVTLHRRENFGDGITDVCDALANISSKYPKNVQLVFPVHLNPQVRKPVFEILAKYENIFLLDPLDYQDFVYMMKLSHLIITDSGGVQEEAPSLGKPVLVTRNSTERPEAVEAGAVKLVGTDARLIFQSVKRLIEDEVFYRKASLIQNPFGDGRACDRIVNQILGREIQQPAAQWINALLDGIRKRGKRIFQDVSQPESMNYP